MSLFTLGFSLYENVVPLSLQWLFFMFNFSYYMFTPMHKNPGKSSAFENLLSNLLISLFSWKAFCFV